MIRRHGLWAAALAVGLALPLPPPVVARDHGKLGQTWPVIEPDLLATIKQRLATLQANGGIERMQQAMVAQARARIRRPQSVEGISPATANRAWAFDPSIVVDKDIRDQKGRLIAAAGTKVNPLDFVPFRQTLVFLDGDDRAQLDWATRRYPSALSAKIIFVSGSPVDQMGAYERRFFFDQRGELTRHFGIRHVPALVTVQGKQLRIEEIALSAQSLPAAKGGR